GAATGPIEPELLGAREFPIGIELRRVAEMRGVPVELQREPIALLHAEQGGYPARRPIHVDGSAHESRVRSGHERKAVHSRRNPGLIAPDPDATAETPLSRPPAPPPPKKANMAPAPPVPRHELDETDGPAFTNDVGFQDQGVAAVALPAFAHRHGR